MPTKKNPPAAASSYQARLDEEHRLIAEEQKAYFREVAEKLATNQPLDELARMVAAAALKYFAEEMPMKRRKARGKPPEFDHLEASVLYHALIEEANWTHEKARGFLANRYTVSEEAIRLAVEKHSQKQKRKGKKIR